MAAVTIFGAGAMGTAFAMHAARVGVDTSLWANPFDERPLAAMRTEGRHPALPEHIPDRLALFGPDELEAAAEGCEVAVMGASSKGARSLAEMVVGALDGTRFVVSLAKGLEAGSLKRVSEVYGEELPGRTVVAVGGPCLAGELAEGHPSAAVWASEVLQDARAAGERFASPGYQLAYSDDLTGVEYCTVVKNVAAIGVGILDGLGKAQGGIDLKNAKAALFTRAVTELATLVTALGGRLETAWGLAGLGDVLVTSLGGRNRLYGELVGEGDDPAEALERMNARGQTVEGVESARSVGVLAERRGVDLPYHRAVERVLLGDATPESVLEVLC